eukprot:3947999-Pyramimonas_sp.AAC.2
MGQPWLKQSSLSTTFGSAKEQHHSPSLLLGTVAALFATACIMLVEAVHDGEADGGEGVTARRLQCAHVAALPGQTLATHAPVLRRPHKEHLRNIQGTFKEHSRNI